MYITVVPNRNSPPAVLLRESYRQNGKVKNRTLANLSKLPPEQVGLLQRVLKGEQLVAAGEVFSIERSLPHGHVAAVLGTIGRIGLDRIIASTRSRNRDLAVVMIAARIIHPCSKLALARAVSADTAFSTLGEGLEQVNEDELYRVMDWLVARQQRIEAKLATRHLQEGTLVLYDMTSVWIEGRCCPLAKIGYSRDGKKNKPQITFGLVCNGDGCPVAVEVFEGNTADPSTLASQIQKVRERFGLEQVVLVGDRGMITEARIRDELRVIPGLQWITALRAPQIRSLIAQEAFDPSLFDQWGLAEIRCDDYPGERLIVCYNPVLAAERRRKRQQLLQATEKQLQQIEAATKREKRRLKGRDKIGVRIGRVLNKYKVGKHYQITITDEGFTSTRNQQRLAQEAALDGFYIIRTNVAETRFSSDEVVGAYKRLSLIEQAFRSLKTMDLKVRPIFHRLTDRVRAHVLLCTLSYYVEWHMRRALAPILFDDHDKATAQAARPSNVAPSGRSPSAEDKARTKRADDNATPVHSFQTLLRDLATLTKNTVRAQGIDQTLEMIGGATILHRRAFELLGVRLPV